MPRKAKRKRSRRGSRIAFFKRLRIEKHGAEGSHTRSEISALLVKQNFKCAVCRVSIRGRGRRHEDHIQPLSRRGSDYIWNIQLLCPPCNYAKGNLTMSEWKNSASWRGTKVAGSHG